MVHIQGKGESWKQYEIYLYLSRSTLPRAHHPQDELKEYTERAKDHLLPPGETKRVRKQANKIWNN